MLYWFIILLLILLISSIYSDDIQQNLVIISILLIILIIVLYNNNSINVNHSNNKTKNSRDNLPPQTTSQQRDIFYFIKRYDVQRHELLKKYNNRFNILYKKIKNKKLSFDDNIKMLYELYTEILTILYSSYIVTDLKDSNKLKKIINNFRIQGKEYFEDLHKLYKTDANSGYVYTDVVPYNYKAKDIHIIP